MSRRLGTLAIWALVAAVAVYWASRLLARPLPVPPSARLATAAPTATADLSRLLGAPRAALDTRARPPESPSRFRLSGVVAGRSDGHRAPALAVALISIDGKPARTYRVGQRVDGELVLQAVTARSATLASAQNAGVVVLELPQPARAGSLPAAVAPTATPAAAAPPAQSASSAAEAPAQTVDMRGNPQAR